MFAGDSLRNALKLTGALLADRGHEVEIVVVGGGALLLKNLIQRPTKDLDAVAIVERGKYLLARPMPEALREAIADAASVLGLDPTWLNPGPTDQLKQGLPEGFHNRTTALVFGGLRVQIAGRFDLICLKLYAAADHAPGSKHVADLIELDPTLEELCEAAVWVKGQDIGVEFPRFVDAVIDHVEGSRGAR